MFSYREQELLQEICKNSKAALLDIHTVLGKVHDEELAYDLNRQAARYSRIEEKAQDRLLEQGVVPEPVGILERTRRWASWQTSTAFNVSTEHVAGMLLREERDRRERLRAILTHRGDVTDTATEMAAEFLDFESESMRILQTYL